MNNCKICGALCPELAIGADGRCYDCFQDGIDDLKEQAHAFRRHEASLGARKFNTFPNRCPVFVASARYDGFGYVLHSDLDPADRLSVVISNGNVWLYPIEDCRPVRWQDVHRNVRRLYLLRFGYKLQFLGGSGPLPLP